MKYRINEIFYSPQGEGFFVGKLRIFVRFTGCNLRCAEKPGKRSPGGFDCDTEFASGRNLTRDELIAEIGTLREQHGCNKLVLTGGEPMMQVDEPLLEALRGAGYWLSMETNGSYEVPDGVDWITVSPKVAEHCIKQRTANEVKYVRGYGQALPKTKVEAEHYYISPAFDGNMVEPRTIEWCKELVKQPDKSGRRWSVSIQKHKVWEVR